LDLKIGVLKKFWYEFVQLNFKEFFPDEILWPGNCVGDG
jgi:hypothetical protein